MAYSCGHKSANNRLIMGVIFCQYCYGEFIDLEKKETVQ